MTGIANLTYLNRVGGFKRFSQDWTLVEEQDMTANYRRLGWREMAKRLNRTKGSILGKANEMNLSGKWVLTFDSKPGDFDPAQFDKLEISTAPGTCRLVMINKDGSRIRITSDLPDPAATWLLQRLAAKANGK